MKNNKEEDSRTKKDKYIFFAKEFKRNIKEQCTFVNYNIHWFYKSKK